MNIKDSYKYKSNETIHEYLLVNIMHCLHHHPDLISCIQDDRIDTHMPISLYVVKSLNVIHPCYSSVISIIDKELCVNQELESILRLQVLIEFIIY